MCVYRLVIESECVYNIECVCSISVLFHEHYATDTKVHVKVITLHIKETLPLGAVTLSGMEQIEYT